MEGLEGWLPDVAAVETPLIVAELPVPLVTSDAFDDLYVPNDGPTYLSDYFLKVLNEPIDPGPQGIGDCVSWAWASAVDMVQCIQIVNKAVLIDGIESDDPELVKRVAEFRKTCKEILYGAMRVNIGGQRGSYQDGAVGGWAAKAVSTIGVTPYKAGQFYSPKLAKQLGAQGIDASSSDFKKIKTTSLVTDFETAYRLIKNGYPVPVCSNQGFTDGGRGVGQRDSEGFCRPRGTWYHAMLFFGAKKGNRPGLCCLQSWGKDTPRGPLLNPNQPNNSFWVDADVADSMLKQRDSFTLSTFDNYEAQGLIDWTF